ncbi:hypothetical protein PG990_009628 [Apiospora arundinis]
MDRSRSAHSPQNNTTSTRKRAISLSGFLGMIIPAHRPEQGGTLRSLDNKSTESAYRDLSINPEELKDWNIAQDLPVRQRLELEENSVGSPRDLRFKRPRNSPAPGRPDTPLPRTRRHLTAAETQRLLESKQRSRQHRRELKHSGDYLGVTGANPYTGEYNILTPTDLDSSDTTPSSARAKMGKLTKNVRQAQRNYEHAKRAEDAAKERHRTEKAKIKLDRIEQVKAEIQQQNGSLQWTQHRREWSSVKEPQLSPIAQSFVNAEVENQPQEHIDEDAFAVSRTDHKGKEPTGALLSGRSASDKGNKLQKRRRNAELSTETIIHTPSRQLSLPVSLPTQDQENSVTRADGQVPHPLRAGKHFLWSRRRRATDPGAAGANEVTVTSLSMTEQNKRLLSLIPMPPQDHFQGLVIPDSRLGIMETPVAQTGEEPPEVNSVCFSQRRDSLTSEPESIAEDWGLSPPPLMQGAGHKCKNQVPKSQFHAVATATSSQSTSKEPTRNRFAILQRLDRSRSATDLAQNMRKPHHHPVPYPSQGTVFRHKTHSQVDVRVVAAQRSVESLVQLRSLEKQTEKILPGPSKEGNPKESHQVIEPGRKADIDQDKKKENTLKAICPPNGILREIEGERTPEWSDEIIETIDARADTHRNKDSVCTPIITTTGCAHALLIQPISGVILGQVDGPATGSTDAPVTRRPSNTPRRLFGKWTNKAEDGTALSHPTTMQSGLPRHGYSRSVPICGTASARIVEIRRPTSSEGRRSLLARGTLRNKKEESKSVQRAISQIEHHPADKKLSEKHREATVQGAARTAMLQSQAKVFRPPPIPPKESLIKPPDKKENIMEKKEDEDANETVAKEETKEDDKDTVVGSPPEPPEPRKRDAMNTLTKTALVVTGWVWSTIRTWWVVMCPVFDGDSELWKRRHREESTWLDVGTFVFTGISLIVGLATGVHILRAVRGFI